MTHTHPASRRPWVIAYVLTSATMWVVGSVLILRRTPGLLRERTLPGPGAQEGYLQETLLYAVPAVAHWLLAAFDRPRRPMPALLQALGLLLYSAANALVIWAEFENPFFSSAVRLQPERGQHVISTGPYAFVRHPGYAAGAAFLTSSALALGSWRSLLPALVFAFALIRRARLEDAFLRKNLAGYAEYANRVGYRLVPGIW